MLSLYLHFPFCKRKCSYCDFCSAAPAPGEIEAYCDALVGEMALMARRYGHLPVDTVFLGGGTPSLIPAKQMARVLQALRASFVLEPEIEFTSEANPGTLTGEWLDAVTEAGVNRLSMGVQAIQPELLQALGRIHTFEQAMESLDMARGHGIENLNADAMFDLPGQTAAQYADTLRALAALRVTHLSAYSLILEEGTPLFDRVQTGLITLPNEDETADQMEQGIDLLETLGYARYEISNFARPGFACRHNLGYWRQKPYLGLGLSAASLLPAEEHTDGVCYVRQTNTADLKQYLRMIGEDRPPFAVREPVGREDAMFETVMLGLRTVAGVSYAEFERMHGKRLTDVYGEAIQTLRAQGLLQPTESGSPCLALNRRGLALQNTALMPFMEKRMGQ